MSMQRKALRIMRDVIGTVLKWNDTTISDKEAMREIVTSLLKDKAPSIPVKESETKPTTVKEPEIKIVSVKEPEIKQEPRSSFRFQKKLLVPIAISGIFFIILFGIVNPYSVFTSVDTNPALENIKIGFEQLGNTDPQNIENIQNKTIEKFITQTVP